MPKGPFLWRRGGRGGGGGGAYTDSSAASKQTRRFRGAGRGKWRTTPGGPEDDVTAPELAITGGNGGFEGHSGVVFVWLQLIYMRLRDALFLKEAQRVFRKQFLMAKYW